MVKAVGFHIDRVSSAVQGAAQCRADQAVLKSWRRSANAHGVDPGSNQAPQILTEGELRNFQEAEARLIGGARVELDRLYEMLRPAHYVLLLCNADGIVIDHRGEKADAGQFRHWGVWLGGIWAENVEGTNGIGTCIAEQRPLTVHRSQHFRSRHIGLSCSGAPIYDGNRKFVGVLDVSSIDPELSEHAHALTGPLTIAAARAIEERLFREQFSREWIVAVRVPDEMGSVMLIAVDRQQKIVGVDRVGNNVLDRWGHRLDDGIGFWTVFEANDAMFRHNDRGDLRTGIMPRGRGQSLAAVATPPDPISARWRQPENVDFHRRSRRESLVNGSWTPEPSQVRGGLPLSKLHRVHEYVDGHLAETIGLDSLAKSAELSPYHFARAFKQSEGLTPHAFILERRLAKARELLSGSDLSLSEIASAVGFADQSHFNRRFREAVGVSPGRFRRARAS